LSLVLQPSLRAIFGEKFSYKVFEHAKITRWQHCNADNTVSQLHDDNNVMCAYCD